MAYIADAVIILILLLAVLFGWRRGFLRTIIQLAGCIAAFLVAFSLSGSLSGYTFDHFIGERLQLSIVSSLENQTSATASEQVQEALDALPASVVKALNIDKVATQLAEEMGSQVSASAPAVAEKVVNGAVRPVAVALLRFVFFLILFILLLIVVGLLGRIIKPLTKLPVLRQADGILGGVVGFLKGCLLVLVVVTVMQLIAVSGVTSGPFTKERLDSSFLTSWVTEHNPVARGLKLN